MGACAPALEGFAALALLRGKRGYVQAKENKYFFEPEGHATFLLPVRTKDIFDVSSQVIVWLLCSCVCSSRLCVAQAHSSCLCAPVVKGVGHQNMKVFPQSLVPFMLNKLGIFWFFCDVPKCTFLSHLLRLLANRRKKNYWGFSVNCTGNEADLSDCKVGREIQMKGNLTCEKGMPVVVSCVPGRTFAPSVSTGFRKAYRVEVSPGPPADIWAVVMLPQQPHFLLISWSKFSNFPFFGGLFYAATFGAFERRSHDWRGESGGAEERRMGHSV